MTSINRTYKIWKKGGPWAALLGEEEVFPCLTMKT